MSWKKTRPRYAWDTKSGWGMVTRWHERGWQGLGEDSLLEHDLEFEFYCNYTVVNREFTLNLYGTRFVLMEDSFSMDWGWRMVSGWFNNITLIVHLIYNITTAPISDHQALDPEVGDPLLQRTTLLASVWKQGAVQSQGRCLELWTSCDDGDGM